MGNSPGQPHVILAKAGGTVGDQQLRRRLTGFCADCWQHANLHHGKDEVLDTGFLLQAGVFEREENRSQCKTERQGHRQWFSSFVDSCLKANKSPGPDGNPNECVKTMSYTELEILRE